MKIINKVDFDILYNDECLSISEIAARLKIGEKRLLRWMFENNVKNINKKERLYLKTLNIIKPYNDIGFNTRQISKETKINDRYILSVLRYFGVQNNNRKSKPSIQISETEAKCGYCGNIYPLTFFQSNRRNDKYQYRYGRCNKCRNEKIKSRNNSDINIHFQNIVTRMRRKCRKNNIEFNIDKEYLIEIYNKQNGLCFYTNEKMEWQSGKKDKKNSLSIDRLIPERGYTKNNIVMCLNRVNFVKNDLSLNELMQYIPSWYYRIIEFLDKT